MTQREGLLLSGVLLVLVAITLPELGSDPWHFRPPSVDPQGPLAPLVRAAGEEWDVGIARSAAFGAALLCGAVAAFLIWRPQPLPRWTGIALVLSVGVLLAAPSTLLQVGPPRLDRALVLHERLDLPGRARRRAPARPGQPVRARLQPLRPRALLHARRQRVGARPRARGRAPPLRLLPRRRRLGGRLAAAARPVRRLPPARAARDARASPRRAAVSRTGRLAARARRGAGLQPDPRALGLVRAERRAEPAAAGARLRAGDAPPLRLGCRGDRRRHPAQAVRDRRAPLHGADGPARGVEAGGPRLRRRPGGGHPAVPDRRPERVLRRHRQVRRRAPTGSWAMACRRSWSASA